MTSRIHRRRFLKRAAALTGAAAGAGLFPSPFVLAERSPNSKLATVVIGCANQGVASLAGAVTERLVALVDVDDGSLGSAMKWIEEHSPETKTSGIKTYSDYRKMFDAMHKQVDAVFVATPDHHHATASMLAIKLGKGVYVEKPMAHSIDEVRRLAAAAREHKVITQMGNQGRSGEGIRRLCEYLWAGAIGNVLETYSWAPTSRGGTGGRPAAKPVPPGLHWDEWIGPAAYRDYHEGLHPKSWRAWWEFGDGSVGDWGCHNLDGPFMALKLGSPTSVEALEQYGGSAEQFPLRNTIRWNFPARGNMPPVKVHWYDGYSNQFDPERKDEEPEAAIKAQNRPPLVAELEKKYGRDLRNGGTIYVGEKGIMHTGNYCGGPRILPEEQHRAFPVPAKSLSRVRGTHQDDFLRACKDGNPSCADFSYSGPLTEMVLLGCLAIKAGVGKRVDWNAEKAECMNLPEVNALVKREYRPGWTL
jgi:predicted dehydrogenase